MVVIGLTGGIGTGKSTVSRMLARRGAVIIDADKVGHAAYKPHTEAWEEVVATFGREILREDGEIDRQRLGEIVFQNPEALKQLNQIVHPKMARMMKAEIEGLRDKGTQVVVLEAAVLIEANWLPLVDEVWVVTAAEEMVVRRLQDGKGLTREQAQARIRSQLSPAERARYASVIIENDGLLSEVEDKVSALWQGLLAKKRFYTEA